MECQGYATYVSTYGNILSSPVYVYLNPYPILLESWASYGGQEVH